MFVYNLIEPYFLDLIILVILIILGLYFYKKGNDKFVKNMILALVTDAEKRYGDKTGELKYATVIDNFYYRAPMIIRLLFTREQINFYIEESVDYLRMYLNDEGDLGGKHINEN